MSGKGDGVLLAFDCESTLIPDRKKIRSKSGESINVSPFEVPDIVLGSAACHEPLGWAERIPVTGSVVGPDHLVQLLRMAIESGAELVGHNIVFDIEVICKYAPHMRALFERAAEEGRLHDTMYLDSLVGLAVGRFDRPVFNPGTRKWSVPDLRSRSLDVLAQEYCGIHLDKDPAIRLCYGQFIGKPISDLPAAFRRYAEDDARATLAVYLRLRHEVSRLGGCHSLSEGLQIRAALALTGLEERGVHVDRELAGRLAASFEEQLGPLRGRLVEAGLGRWEPKHGTRVRQQEVHQPDAPLPGNTEGEHQGPPLHAKSWALGADGKIHRNTTFKRHIRHETAEPRFVLNMKAVQAALAALPVDPDMDVPRRDDGSVSCEAEGWSEWLPPDSPLHDWVIHQKVQKILSSYLSVFQQTDIVFPRWICLGARTGRMAASKPAIQQIPKRKAGIRALFVPSPGRVFCVADYSSQELFCLAETMLEHGIIGNLYKVLTSGVDAHRYTAALVLRKPMDQVTKEERQTTKACAFGCPGGLGAKKLAAYAHNYGARWTVEEAAERRQAYFDAFPDVYAYLRRMKTSQDDALRAATGQDRRYWAERLGTEHWNVIKAMSYSTDPAIAGAGHEAERQCRVELRSGRQRSHCRFSEGANSGFQGPASDVTKTAVWKAFRAGLQIVMVVHDEIVIETTEGNEACDTSDLIKSMKDAFVEICPRMGPYAQVEVKSGLLRWGAATDLSGKEMSLDKTG